MTMRRLIRLSWFWGLRCFGPEHMSDVSTRSLRCGEEVIELMQACKVPKDIVHKLVDVVYSRPEGRIYQEIGGAILTLGVLCEAMNMDIENALFTELARCLEKDPAVFTKRNQDKIDLGLKVGG